ncbi:MAG: hypothetical protein IPO27_14825 [Bacteroidetes bacterium]|nr:hypothetical protein [Bacteroidota bacterium]
MRITLFNKAFLVPCFFLTTFFICNSPVVYAQSSFAIQIDTAPITVMPAWHSGAVSHHNGYWILIGGRVNGLHGFQPANGFPLAGANQNIYVIDYKNDVVYSQSVAAYNSALYDHLTASSYQFLQRDSILYISGGYGFGSASFDYITFPLLTAVNLNRLISDVISQTSAEALFKTYTDTVMAVTGGQMMLRDNRFSIVFGHRFDGYYSENDSSGFYVQHYTNQIRSFEIIDTNNYLGIANYTTVYDSLNFHRRDYNLVPQIFPNGKPGHTAFTGVFRYEADLPFLDCINIDSAGSWQLIPNFNQNLNQYHTATMPVYDAVNNDMHNVFFGGMSLYYLDSITSQPVIDTMVPFVNTISKVVRKSDSSMVESAFGVRMPALLGTNAHFIPADGVDMYDNGVIKLNALSGNTLVGYIAGGIKSPAPNISKTGVWVSSAVSTVYRVWVDPSATKINDLPVTNTIYDLIVYPNPAADYFTFQFNAINAGEAVATLYEVGSTRTIWKKKIQLLKGSNKFLIDQVRLSAGTYAVEVEFEQLKKATILKIE